MLRFLSSEFFAFAIILCSTAALIGVGQSQPGSNEHTVWVTIEVICVVLFVFEVVAKVMLSGWRGYWADKWNRFDFVITLLSLPVLGIPFWGINSLSGVPILRMARLFRLLRFLRFIPDRDNLAKGVSRALRASIGVFLALTLLNFIFAMGAHTLFGQDAPQHFGDPLTSIYSMFQVFTLEGWHEISADLASVHPDSWGWNWLSKGYLVASVFFGGILGFSLANAVFVDQMMLDNNDDIGAKIDRLSEQVAELQRSVDAGVRRGN